MFLDCYSLYRCNGVDRGLRNAPVTRLQQGQYIAELPFMLFFALLSQGVTCKPVVPAMIK
jgi:hypothetical protein